MISLELIGFSRDKNDIEDWSALTDCWLRFFKGHAARNVKVVKKQRHFFNHDLLLETQDENKESFFSW